MKQTESDNQQFLANAINIKPLEELVKFVILIHIRSQKNGAVNGTQYRTFS